MLKIVSPGSWEGLSEPTTQLVKVSSRGLRGNDLTEFVKRAGHEFVSSLDLLRPGEVPVLLIAMGATEAYACNRNGDGFSKRACREYHDTFVKHARWYRDHCNKDPQKSYGRVIKSAYNEQMNRVELLAALFSTKEAAFRERALVADKEMEKLAKGEEIPVSMACRIPYDVCSFCRNEAANRSEYCDTKPVKLASGRVIPTCTGFGAKHGLTKIAKDGRQQYVDNPQPDFFDISHVYRNADRIAFALGQLEKAANHTVISGNELAELWELTPLLSFTSRSNKVAKQAEALRVLVEYADASWNQTDRHLCDSGLWKQAGEFNPPIKVREHPIAAPMVYRALADAGVCLGPREWLHLEFGKEGSEEAGAEIAEALPGAFQRLAKHANLEAELASNPFMPGDRYPPKAWRDWAESLADSRGLREDQVSRRLKLAAIREIEQPRVLYKSASPSHEAKAVAEKYALYQVGYFASQRSQQISQFDLTPTLLVRQQAVGWN